MDPIEKVRELNLNKAAWVQSSINMNNVTEEVSMKFMSCISLRIQIELLKKAFP